MKQAKLIIGIVIIAVMGFFLWRHSQDSFVLLRGGETPAKSFIMKDGVAAGDVDASDVSDRADNPGSRSPSPAPPELFGMRKKEMMVTRGVKHSVPWNQIIEGGPPKDGIPSLDEPKFISIFDAGRWLRDDDLGIAFSKGETHRFYPYQILVWHEIVNDTVDGERVLVTYCPLCFSGIVFDPQVLGERVEFGTSGKLWNSNLVMYDRKTESLWSQVLGEAIAGEMTGTRLKVLPSDIVRFGEWKKRYPKGQVLSRDTGTTRQYGSDPYGDYYTSDAIYFPVNKRDDRLHPKAFVFGLMMNGKAKAYSVDSVKTKGEVVDAFEGADIVARYDQELDAVQLFRKQDDGTLERLNPFPTYWFSWVAAHPDTQLYR